MTKHSGYVLAAVSCAVIWQLASSHADASGYQLTTLGGELGSVVATNPTAVYYNPGALGWSGSQVMVDAMFVMRGTSWTHTQGQGEVAEPPGFEGSNYGTARSFLMGGGPQFITSLQLGDHLVLGAGAFIPFGGGTIRFDRNDRFENSMYPGAADGITRWHAYEAGMMAFYATAGAAVRFGSLSFGAVFNLIWSSLSGKRALSSAGNNDITHEQRMSFDVKKVVASFALGAMWEVFPNQLWLAASYQAQPGLGEFSMDGTSTISVMDQTRTQDVTMHQSMPDIIRSGIRVKPSPSVELRWTASFTRWSVNQTQCTGLPNLPCVVKSDGSAAPGSGAIKVLRRNWQDTIGVHGGASYWLFPELELFAGVGYEPAAVPDATLDPVATDANNFTSALGVRLRLFETWLIALSYHHTYFLLRDNTGKSDLANPSFGPIVRNADGGGKYEQWFASANLNVATTF